MIPPWLIHLRIRRSGRRRIGLWVPVFLFWPLIWLLALVAMALALVVGIIVAPWGWARPVICLVPWLMRMLSASKGLRLQVAGDDSEFCLRVF